MVARGRHDTDGGGQRASKIPGSCNLMIVDATVLCGGQDRL